MSDTWNAQEDEVALSEYAALAEAWARQGGLLRALSLCRVLLRLEPGHEPARRLLTVLEARRVEPLVGASPTGPVSPEPASEKDTQEGESRVSLLSRLGEREFLAVMESLELRVFQPGETIVDEGEPGSSMFAIVEGSVEVVRTLKTGRRRTVAFLGEGDFFGEMSILSDEPRFATVKAFERTAVLELTRERLERIVQRNPSVQEVLRAVYREHLLDDVLRGSPLFKLLTPARRKALARDFQLCTRPAGTLLLEQGHEVDALYVLQRGHCQVLHQHPDGRTSPLRTLGEGDMVGEISLMLGVPATATVRTETPCTLLRLDWVSCEKHLLEQPEVFEALSRLSNERLLNTAGLLWEPSSNDGAPRLDLHR